MNQDPLAVRIKQARRLILSNLNRVYPTPLQVRTLYRVMCTFDENYSLDLMEKDVVYLKQKKYLSYVDEAIGGIGGGFENKFLGLTAAGKEIADRTQTDKALEI